MDQEKTKKLWDSFPNLYCDKNAPITHSLIPFGFECGNGWYDLIWDLSEKLEKLIIEYKEKHPTEYCPRAVQVKEKFGCYDDKTEVLTKDGWKFFKDVTFSDEIATLKDGHYLEYSKPVDIIAYEYTGKMYKLKTRGVSLVVTPNHNLYVAKGLYYDGRHKPPKKRFYPFALSTPDKYFGKNKMFQKGCKWIGEDADYFILPETRRHNYFKCGLAKDKRLIKRQYKKNAKNFKMLDWLEFLGFYIAEGCCDKKRGSVSVACCNVDKGKEKKYVAELLDRLGIQYALTQENKSALIFRIYDKQLVDWLLTNCGHLAQNKKVPYFVKWLGSDSILRFLTGLYNGDGCQQKTSHTLTTVSNQLANDVQELILKTGFSSYCYKREPKCNKLKNSNRQIIGKFPSYEINWLNNSYYHNTQNKGLSKKSVERWVSYTGQVYCVTVPNNILMVRKDGLPVWCGNSLRFYMSGSTDEMEGVIYEAEAKVEITCETCGKPGILYSDGWCYTACEEHTKK